MSRVDRITTAIVAIGVVGFELSLNSFWIHAAAHPEREVLVEPDGRRVRAGDLMAATHRNVRGLRALGLGQGDTVATLLGNGATMVEVALSAGQAGMYVTPVNPRLTAHEVAFILADCGARAVGCDPQYAAQVAEALGRADDEMPATDEECDVDLAVKLSDTELTEGDVTEAKVTVKNTLAEPIPAPIAIVGIPGGLEVRHDQLKELVKAGKIATYEVLGRDVVLYWRELAANQKLELPLSIVAEIQGSCKNAKKAGEKE